MDALNGSILGAPLYAWGIFLAIVFALLIFDLGFFSKGQKEVSIKKSLILSSFYIAIGLAFSFYVGHLFGPERSAEYITGFIVEKTLAIDNVFVIAMIFSYFAIPNHLQQRVLILGIIGVLVLRGIMIFAGAALVSRYEWILYIFAAFLIFTGIKLLLEKEGHKDLSENKLLMWLQKKLPVTNELHGEKFIVKQGTKWFMTPLFLALIMVEIADLIFAIDSIPAIFAITTDPFVVFTSNIFAILGLRSLYFALAALIDRFEYLKYSLGVLLVFIGGKVFAAELLHMEKFPTNLALGITAIIIAAGIIPSFFIKKQSKE